MPRASKLVLFATLALLAGAASALSAGGRAAADTNEAGPNPSATPPPDVMFKLAKGAWRARTDVPFVTFNMRERYTWRGHVHDNWWSGYYRDSDRDLVLHRMIVPEEEAARMRGFPIGLDIHFHKNPAHVDSFDTSASADAFPILDPLIEPNGSFGMLAHDSIASLAGATGVAAPRASAPAAGATAAPAPAQSPSIFATEKPLRTLVRVEAVARDYAIAFVGTDKLESGDAYHLALTPLRDPQTFRLRDLWIDPSSYATLELGMRGLFEGKPYDDARWIVTSVQIGGRYYIRDIRAGDALRFGMDRTVSDLRFDFVGYDFPATIPETTFRRLL